MTNLKLKNASKATRDQRHFAKWVHSNIQDNIPLGTQTTVHNFNSHRDI